MDQTPKVHARTLRLSPSLADRLKAETAHSKRSENAEIEYALERHLDEAESKRKADVRS